MSSLESSSLRVRAALAALVVVSVFYLLQVLSPLRIDNDSSATLRVAINLADIGSPGRMAFPLGYPLIVAGMMRAGIANAHTLVALNLIFVAVAMGALWHIGRDYPTNVRIAAVALTLLSYPIIKMTPLAHPDMVAFGLLMLALALLTSVTGMLSRRNALLLVLVAMITVAATSVRFASLILVVPIAATLWIMLGGGFDRRSILIASAIVATMAIGIIATLALSDDGTFVRYGEEIGRLQKRGPVSHVLKRIAEMLAGIGEATLNFPTHRFRGHGDLKPRLWIPGVIPALMWILVYRRPRWSPVVSAYMIGFLVMLAVWPFYTIRLWMPIIPLIVLHGVFCLYGTQLPARIRIPAFALAGLYVVCGITALLYTTRISLAGEQFRHRWGTNGGLAHPGHERSGHNRIARTLARRFDAGGPGWRWLDSVPESEIQSVEATPGGRTDSEEKSVSELVFR